MSDLRGTNAPRDVKMGNTGKIAAAIAVVAGLAAVGAVTYATSPNHAQTVKVASNDVPAPLTPPPASVSKPTTTPPDRTAPVLDTQTPATPKAAAAVRTAPAPSPVSETRAPRQAATLKTEPIAERRVKPVTPPTLPTQSESPQASAPAAQTEASPAPAPAAQPTEPDQNASGQPQAEPPHE